MGLGSNGYMYEIELFLYPGQSQVNIFIQTMPRDLRGPKRAPLPFYEKIQIDSRCNSTTTNTQPRTNRHLGSGESEPVLGFSNLEPRKPPAGNSLAATRAPSLFSVFAGTLRFSHLIPRLLSSSSRVLILSSKSPRIPPDAARIETLRFWSYLLTSVPLDFVTVFSGK